jgi:AcrR family transcriptional regulator
LASPKERGEERRAAIVDAALALFSTHGYRGTSVAAVAEKAGVTDAGVLYHFKTKADLLLAVLAHHDDRYTEMARAAYVEGPAAELAWLREWGETMEREEDLTALLVTLSAEHLREESPTNGYFRRRYAAVRRSYERMFRMAAEAGLIRADVDVVMEATITMAVLDGLRLQWFFTDRRTSIAEALRAYFDGMMVRLQPTA